MKMALKTTFCIKKIIIMKDLRNLVVYRFSNIVHRYQT